MVPYPLRVALTPRTSANQQLASISGVSTPCGAYRFYPRCVGVVDLGRISDPGRGPYPPRVALAHTGFMAGLQSPFLNQPYRKSQQPLAWIWCVGKMESANRIPVLFEM